MTDPVKPCPFCGGPPKVETILTNTQVFCNQMACPLNVGTVHFGSVEGAIAAWNRRATGQTEREATEPSEAMVTAAWKAFTNHGFPVMPGEAQRERRALSDALRAALTPPQDSRSLASTPPETEK